MRIKLYTMSQSPEQAEVTKKLRLTGCAMIGHEVVTVVRDYVEIPEPGALGTMRFFIMKMLDIAKNERAGQYSLKALLWVGWPQTSWLQPGFGYISDGQQGQAMAEFLGRMRLEPLIPISTPGYAGMEWQLSKEEFIAPDADPENVKKATAANNMLNGKL